LGADTVEGGAGDDIVIGAKTAYDAPTTASLDALEAIMQEWTQPDVDYVTRRDNVLGSGLLSGEAVLDDGLKDVLSGDQDRDWFFARLGTGGDALQDRKSNETVTSV
jgi:hypothetical protein